MVRRESFINKIRTLDFKYKTQQKRTYLYRQSGTTNYISVPMADLLDDDYVRNALRQAGCKQQEIDSFLSSAKA
jgi:hypothetical protein